MTERFGLLTRMESPVTGPARDDGGARIVERILRNTPGVVAAHVDPDDDTAYITFDPGRVTAREIRERLATVGFLPWEAV